jgi:hypothetical protein
MRHALGALAFAGTFLTEALLAAVVSAMASHVCAATAQEHERVLWARPSASLRSRRRRAPFLLSQCDSATLTTGQRRGQRTPTYAATANATPSTCISGRLSASECWCDVAHDIAIACDIDSNMTPSSAASNAVTSGPKTVRATPKTTESGSGALGQPEARRGAAAVARDPTLRAPPPGERRRCPRRSSPPSVRAARRRRVNEVSPRQHSRVSHRDARAVEVVAARLLAAPYARQARVLVETEVLQ